MNKVWAVGSALVLLAGSCSAVAEWETDFAKAQDTAKAENSCMLVDFTGSDWCHWCKVLKEKVFDTEVFESYAKENKLLLVEMDFPRTPGAVTMEQMMARDEVRKRYAVNSFPTILLISPGGEVFARLSGAAADAQEYIQRLKSALDCYKEFKSGVDAAQQMSGEQKAFALVEAIEKLPKDCQGYQEKLINEIIENDPEDKTGYGKKMENAKRAMAQMQMLSDFFNSQRGPITPDRVIASREAALDLLKKDDLLPFIRMVLYKYVSDCYAMERNLPKTHEYLKAAIDAAPDHPDAAKLRAWLENLEKNMNQSDAK